MTTVKPEHLELETSLLKAFSVRENFETYYKVVDKKRVLPNTKTLLEFYEQYFGSFSEHKDINWGDLYTLMSESNLDSSDLDYYKTYVIPTVRDSRIENTETVLKNLAQKNCVENIINSVQKTLDVSKLREILDAYEQKQTLSLDKDIRTAETIDLDVLDKSQGVPWFLPALQQSIMSLTAGQFVVVSADWGTGKSAFVISQAVHAFKWAQKQQHPRPILFCNSEGTDADVLGRFWSNLYKEKIVGGFEEIVDRRLEVREKFLKNYNHNLFQIVQMSDCPTYETLAAKVKKIKPSLIIIDICDKLAPDEDPKNLKKLYDSLRLLAVECPIIGTSQSGDTAYYDEEAQETKNRKWLGGNKTYGSKTGKQGAADTLITIGKEDEYSNLRYIAVPKKKRGEQTKITCQLKEKYSLYKQLNI
jgi:hypothetical protein